METTDMTGMLGFGTLFIGLAVAVIIWLRFMRKAVDRHLMKGERERNLGEIREESGKQGQCLKTLSEF